MKLTVITVCFNAAKDLKKTLDSVLTQTFIDFEYLVIDGGSKDNTLDLLETYKLLFAKAGKIFRYVSEADKGTYDAMNKGASLANGEWINYMNAGDSFYANSTLQDFFLPHGQKVPGYYTAIHSKFLILEVALQEKMITRKIIL